MIYGTHNSATGGKLLWWLRPLAWVINPTSKCQSKSIDEQLKDGVKLFNLQVAYNGERWYFSHGLALYKEDVFETIAKMKACATAKEPIYFQLYLDKSVWYSQDELAFAKLVADIKSTFICSYFVMLSAWVEGTNKYPHKSESKLKWQERYWTTTWASINATSLLDKLPLPKYHAKRFNARYKAECNKDYIMLDFLRIMNFHLNLTQDVGHGITLIFICFVVVLAAVLIDLLVALVAEYKIGHSIESHKLRKSIIKVILYYSALLYGVLVDVIGLAFTWYDIPYTAILATLGVVLIEGKSMWEKHKKIQSAVTELPEIIGKIIAASSKKDAIKILELLKNKKDEEK